MAGPINAINNYTLGNGAFYFAPYRPGTQIPMGELYMGNSPEFSLTIAEETLDHFNSDRGTRDKDASVPLQTNRTGSLTLDDINHKNVGYYLQGESKTITVAGATVTAEPLGGAGTTIQLGASYQLGTNSANPTGARQVSAVALANATTSADVPVAGIDYLLDPVRGRVMILETATKVKEGDLLTVNYTVDASTREQVASTAKTVEGQLRYIADNKTGNNVDYLMPRVKLTPNGDFNFKGDDWQTIPLTVEILKKAGMEAIYADGQPYNPAP